MLLNGTQWYLNASNSPLQRYTSESVVQTFFRKSLSRNTTYNQSQNLIQIKLLGTLMILALKCYRMFTFCYLRVTMKKLLRNNFQQREPAFCAAM